VEDHVFPSAKKKLSEQKKNLLLGKKVSARRTV